MRILHVLHHSEPYLDGYGVRSKSIVESQRGLGLVPVVVTSPHHELELRRSAGTTPDREAFGSTTYYRTATPASGLLRLPLVRERAMMRALERRISSVLERETVDLVHAHSPVLCGLPALNAARRAGLPFVYEVRAFWEDAMLASKLSPARSAKYALGRRLETTVLRRADAVVAISQHMIDDIADRGIPRTHLFMVPNGVDSGYFKPAEPDQCLITQLGVKGHQVVGFIGSFFHFEGLECLVRAMPAILQEVPKAKLVLVGTGEAEQSIRELVSGLRLSESVVQVGRVPHNDILRYYSIMDVLVYPRRSERLTELVTPLKPLEAIAAGKAVVGSDVGGIRELLDDGNAGDLFKAGDEADLARVVVRLLTNGEARAALCARARRYVSEQRQWGSLVSKYLSIYAQVTR